MPSFLTHHYLKGVYFFCSKLSFQSYISLLIQDSNQMFMAILKTFSSTWNISLPIKYCIGKPHLYVIFSTQRLLLLLTETFINRKPLLWHFLLFFPSYSCFSVYVSTLFLKLMLLIGKACIIFTLIISTLDIVMIIW